MFSNLVQEKKQSESQLDSEEGLRLNHFTPLKSGGVAEKTPVSDNERIVPFSNQMIVDQFNNSEKKDSHNSAIKSLQQKILDTNF
jgi:hypothetical protein